MLTLPGTSREQLCTALGRAFTQDELNALVSSWLPEARSRVRWNAPLATQVHDLVDVSEREHLTGRLLTAVAAARPRDNQLAHLAATYTILDALAEALGDCDKPSPNAAEHFEKVRGSSTGAHVAATGSPLEFAWGILGSTSGEGQLGRLVEFVRLLASDVAEGRKAELAQWEQLVAGAAGRGTVEPTASLQVHQHALHRFPRGPVVPLDWIPNSLVEAFADEFSEPDTIVATINSAIRMRREADPGDRQVQTVRLARLPNPGQVAAYTFWMAAFNAACRQGPRMLAALLAMVPDEKLPADVAPHVRRLTDDLIAIR